MGGEGKGERQSLCRKSQDKGGQVLVLLVLLALLLLNDIVCATDDQGGQVALGIVVPLLVLLVLLVLPALLRTKRVMWCCSHQHVLARDKFLLVSNMNVDLHNCS